MDCVLGIWVFDVCSFLNQPPHIHLLDLSETRLDYRISDESVVIPNYSIRDATYQGETGLYVHRSILPNTTRRTDIK